MIEVNFAHLCDTAFFSKEEKLNIIGIFKNINTGVLPFAYPKMTFVVSLLTDEMQSFKAQILKKDTNEVISKVEANPRETKKLEKVTEINFLNDFINTKFEEEGEYFLEVWFGKKILTKIPFSVRLITKK